MVAVRGKMALVVFDDTGALVECSRFGAQLPGTECSALVEVPAGVWHTVISMGTGSVLLEVKAGPFDPGAPKEHAEWAPAERSPRALAYLTALHRAIMTMD